MIRYKTVMKEAIIEQVIEKSRFIAHVKPVESKAEAEDYFSQVRAKHRNATHNVPAFVIGEKLELQWASDDGEPQGTSGAPMVQMLVKEGISNVAVIVTRYFGGVKLGTGGLVRAYTSSAKLGLEAAILCDVKEQMLLRVKIAYTHYDRLQNLSVAEGFFLKDADYTDAVTVSLTTDPLHAEEIKKQLSNLTGGTAEILEEALQLVKVHS
ncbi:YigZ family protein [Sinanaerobacter sp. ZZT-01]|uniref:YigZ family protein n=1 Tax=Sinanaerobacter sp. ZZT-01 TaxID=3111540 RepID=UPI002D78CB99|nr:YigZ family protein [Sinanaerobacter sp. ZZT-01]WRR92772.1 YigZ family protein [Sinanaerobacter sp. ZZT-01]